ncbi:MAG: S53 family peptidase [Candidatus Dormibacteria bacterium]
MGAESSSPAWPNLGPVDPDEPATVTLVLRPRPDRPTPLPSDLGGLRPSLRAHLSRYQLEERRSAHPQDLQAVEGWARATGLEWLGAAPALRTASVRGSLGRLSDVFGVELRRSRQASLDFRWQTSPPTLPVVVAEQLVAVLGLGTQPRARPHFRRLPLPDTGAPLAAAAPLSYPPAQVAELYSFPPGTNGAGQSIGLVELGGGYRQADLDAYFQEQGLAPPTVVPVPVAGGANRPTGAVDGPDGEVVLDIEVSGSVAPGVSLAVYFAPNTDQGFLAAIQAALHDQSHHPTLLSISWGGPESAWDPGTMTAFDQVFQDMALVGIAVCVASGDQGSSDGLGDGQAHVDFPASSPHVLACGGTRLSSSGGVISGEATWNDEPQGGATGGGVSTAFSLPAWQARARVPPSVDPGHAIGRGVPDVAGDADPETGYRVLVDGQATVFGGTSAVAPLWAGLLARCAQSLGHPVGYLNPMLYQTLEQEGVTRDITQGDNGAYAAGPGWDACTGWGSPWGEKLLAALSG